MIRNYEEFKLEILRMSGIDLTSYKERQMKRRIDSLISKNDYSNYDEYVKSLKMNKKLYEEFINYLTINVSEFYRNPTQWEVLEKEIIPQLLKKTSRLKIWSAACSTGDEPYSLVMMLSRSMPLSQIKILATDIDLQVIEKAKIGLYNDKSLQGLPNDLKNKFFTPIGNSFKISEEIKRCVEFKQHNLLQDPYPSDCDLIVCRNVLIYFTEEAKAEIYEKFNKALKSDGVLFVGSTEQIILSNRYHFSPLKTFFYQKDNNL